jgi:catechol 2,3-dioxygenase-like lactoylglutathione lyase family enzyme
MLTGAHVMIFTENEEADRAFLRDVLELPCIDSGGGWLIFKLPPTELGVHEGENGFHQVYFICDDVDAFVARMKEKRVATEPIAEQDWGRSTGVMLPGGGKLGIYQPTHARP